MPAQSQSASWRARGQIIVFTVVTLAMLVGFTSLAIDIGYAYTIKAELQNAADAAALAAVQALAENPDSEQTVLLEAAREYASKNHAVADILDESDFEIGHWDSDAEQFSPNAAPLNSARVVTRRAEQNQNALGLFFAGVFGITRMDVSAEAVALAPTPDSGGGSRFLIDDEMIDSDVPVLENLANSIGMDKENIIKDQDGDWFIDLWKHCGSVNCQFELPTGQVGDEALFDMNNPTFPFSQTSDPSFEDFLNYNEDSSSWRYNLIDKALLDPLHGVSSVSDGSLYESYVNPDFVQVSPVYKSDVSKLNPNPDPQVNALGMRRGLIAFKIIDVGSDPDGSGSKLPNLVIEVVSPAEVDLSTLSVNGSAASPGKLQLVR